MEVFQGLGTWIDIYDTASTARRRRRRSARRARCPNGLDRDGERPLGNRRRRPGGARPARRRASCPRDRRRRLVPPGPRPPRARSSPGAGDALVPDAAGRRVRRRRARHRVAAQQERQAADGARCSTCSRRLRRRSGLDAGRGDHVPAAGLRAAPELVARLPVGARSRRRSTRSSRCSTPAAASRDTTRHTATSRARCGCCGTPSATRSRSMRPAASRTGWTAEELQAFTDAVLDDGSATGWSLYDLQTTTPAGWAAMARLDAQPASRLVRERLAQAVARRGAGARASPSRPRARA